MKTTETGTNPQNHQKVVNYFEKIKGNQAALRQFFTVMPKGGDLHNHLTGSAYAETYFELAAKKGLYVDLATGMLYKEKPKDIETIQLSPKMDDLHNHRMALIDKWSIRNFHPYKYPLGPDEYFFGTFGLLSALTSDTDDLAYLMHKLKVRAVEENVQYLEVIGISPDIPEYCFLSESDYRHYDEILKTCVKKEDYTKAHATLKEIISKFKKSNEAVRYAKEYCDKAHEIEDKSSTFTDPTNCDTSNLVCTYQGYAVRNLEPLQVLAQLYIIHSVSLKEYEKSLVRNNNPIGCNIVAAEDGEKSMLYYRLHMEMFNVLSEIDRIKTSLHAGELTMGLVRPEHLAYHISLAINTAKANRIGHGVDLPFESDSDNTLKMMKEQNIPVEINLTSNEFILGVKDSEHPVTLYRKAGVPIIISTDDPGILRTSLTEQYTLAALRYEFSYEEIKTIVYNSIEYSFVEDDDKELLRRKLNKLFADFESKVSNW